MNYQQIAVPTIIYHRTFNDHYHLIATSLISAPKFEVHIHCTINNDMGDSALVRSFGLWTTTTGQICAAEKNAKLAFDKIASKMANYWGPSNEFRHFIEKLEVV